MMPVLYLFDDARARRWVPFTASRPVGELLHGALLQRERAEGFWGAECAGHLADPVLRGFREEGAPPVVAPDELTDDDVRIFFSSRCVPTELEGPDLEGTVTLKVGETVVGWVLGPDEQPPGDEVLLHPDQAPVRGEVVELDGTVPAWPWDLVDANPARLRSDLGSIHSAGDSFLLTDVHVVGDGVLSLGHHARIDPGVILDLRDGPIRLDDGVRVDAPARLTGPLFVGAGTEVLGGSVGRSSIGPACKIRGEVDASVILAYCNKAHDGYLGHAYLGRWVNLGAQTTNSDLKNNYSPVRVPVSPHEELDTGLLKVGCLVGDHVKTGIGTLLNTGTVLGLGSNVFGGAMPPRWVPPFSWGRGTELSEHRLEKFLQTAEAAMARRDVELSEQMRELLSRSWEASRDQRS